MIFHVTDQTILGTTFNSWWLYHITYDQDEHDKIDKDVDESEFGGDSLQLNVGQQSFGEQSITDDSHNVTNNCDQEVSKAREILEETENMMKENSKKSDQSTTSLNETPRQVGHQQKKSALCMAERTKSHAQTNMISLGYLNHIR